MSCIGVPIAAATAVPVIVIVAIIEGAEQGARDRPCRRDGATHNGARRTNWPHGPAILVRCDNRIGVAEPFAAISFWPVATVFGLLIWQLLPTQLASFAPLAIVPLAATGPANGGGAEDRKTELLIWMGSSFSSCNL